jgi:hypothetical protein
MELKQVEGFDPKVGAASIYESFEIGGAISVSDMWGEASPCLRRDYRAGACSTLQNRMDEPFGAAIAIYVGRVDEGDAAIESRV